MGRFSVHYSLGRIALTAIFAGQCVASCAQLPFFPGAEGFGGTWTGTSPAAGWLSDATVYRVTNLNDSGPGSLRGAFVQNSLNKIVVFDVAGTINLSSTLDIKNLQNYYIAGQTAPGPVTIIGATTLINASNNRTNRNIVLRYLSFRGSNSGDDTVGFKNGDLTAPSTNMIFDHLSASWSQDEILSVANKTTNVTVQYSTIHDALRPEHAYGSLIRPEVDSNVTFHHNLYANNASRQARFGTYDNKLLTSDFRNNIIYNYRDRASYAGGSNQDLDTVQEFANVNYVGNYIIAGPGTGTGPDPDDYGGEYVFRVDKNITAQVYQSGNYLDADEAPGGAPADGVLDGSDTGENMFVVSTVTDQSLAFMDNPFAAPPVTTQTAPAAYQQLVEYAGNWWWDRDAIDSRVISNVTGFTGVPLAAAGPIQAEMDGLLAAPMLSHGAGYDADNDGMQDEWEAKHGGNLVWNADFDNDGYINLVEFINELGEFPAPAPIVFNGGLNNRYAHIMNWKTSDGVTAGSNWQPSKYDEAQVNSGTVVVDSVGQHAGVLRIAATAGSNAQLQVNSGWLEVADTIEVGAHATGQGTLTLGGGQISAEDVVIGYLGQLRGSGALTGDVTNGGTILPGNSPGTITIHGDYTQTLDGILTIDLASADSFDKLVVNGDVDLGGVLEIKLLGDFMPAIGTEFNVLDWTGTQSGLFDILALDDLNSELAWDTSLVDSQGVLKVIAASTPLLAGDYNNDGSVDAADYTVWRNAMGGIGSLENETVSIGTVDGDDYTEWKANFGAVGPNGGGASGSVPEPGTSLLLSLGMMGLSLRRRARN